MKNDKLNPVDQQALDSIEYHFNALVEKPALEINQLPESIFAQVFLPFFCGEKNLTDEPDILVKWISIAGNPTKEVQIIDENSNPIFKVPALADSSIFDVTNAKGGQPFYNIIMNYELHKNQLPVIGQKYLNNSISERFQSLTKSSTVYAANEKEWNTIFVRYGKVKADLNKASDDKTRMDQDEIEYD